MTDWETTKLKGHVKHDAAALEGYTYTEVMRAGIDALEGTESTVNSETADIDTDELAERIVDAVGATAGGPEVDDSEIAREVARQLDYTAIADKVSEQVVRELQR